MTLDKFDALVCSAEDGDVAAQYDLAENYHYGRGVPRNYSESEKWYLRCLDRCPECVLGPVYLPIAQCGLGLLYLKRIRKIEEGMRLLALAGGRGEYEACFELAKALRQPVGQDSERIAAYAWLCLAESCGPGVLDKWDKVCKKEIELLESELSTEQLLAAQAQVKDMFPEAQRSLAAADEARRADKYAKLEGENRRVKVAMGVDPDASPCAASSQAVIPGDVG